MPGPWTDAHCHLADARFGPTLEDVFRRSIDAGVTTWVQGGVGPDDWKRQAALKRGRGPSIVSSFGLHPWWVAAADDAAVDGALAALEECLPEADALGEVGLDAHPRRGALERQRRALRAQLALAHRHPRPLVLHVVRADHEVLGELERHGPFPRGGLVHGFAGKSVHARRYIELGLHLSIGGALVSRPERARELASIDPAHVVIETDAPDQAPRGWGVACNEPAFLPRIAAELAPLWGFSAAELLDRAHISLKTLFSP